MQKSNQKEFRVVKVIKRKGDKLHVKWNDYNSNLNIWIDEKDMGEYKSASMSDFFPKSSRVKVELAPFLDNLIKRSDVVKNDIVKKDVYNPKTKTI